MAHIEAIFSIIFICFVWFVLLKNHFTDNLRLELFKHRDHLFLYAAEGNISFDHPAFIYQWDLINGLIRMAHKRHLFFTQILFDPHIGKCTAVLIEKKGVAFSSLEPKNKQYMSKLEHDLNTVYIKHLVFTSFILFGYVSLVIFYKLLKKSVFSFGYLIKHKAQSKLFLKAAKKVATNFVETKVTELRVASMDSRFIPA